MIFILIVKHWVCDFLLQTRYMAEGKGRIWFGHNRMGFPKKTNKWIGPMFIHAGVNAIGTSIVLASFGAEHYVLYGLAELFIHAGIDRAKVLINAKYDVIQLGHAYHMLYGADQAMHMLWLALIARIN